jgi:hypothetical protein
MKVAIILGRGVEGCGVTKCAVEMKHMSQDNTIFATMDKKWPRGKGFNEQYHEFICADMLEVEQVANIINAGYDLCVVYSVPSKDHSDECQNNFISLLKSISIRKCFINADHKMQSIVRNAKLKETCANVDVVMTHSLENDFCVWAKREGVVTPIKKMSLGFNFDEHRAEYWQPIENQQSNMVRWIGRSAGWKGPELMMEFHEASLMPSGFITVLEGLEASIGYKGILYRDKLYTDRRKVMNYFRPEKEHGELTKFTKDLHGKEVVGVGAYLYPPYTNVEGMRRLALSAFGSDLYNLPARSYGNNIENCHAEIIAGGSIPLFHKHFCDNVIHRKQGLPISQCKNTGTIGLDATNYDECVSMMQRLKNDNVLRDEWREMAFEFWREHCNADDVINEIFKNAF